MADELATGQRCLNCNAPLHGQYCGQCGQRAVGRLISVWELVRDAFGDLFELDSRLWRTLLPLMARPGQLTRDYLQGRRARYMPPFRMYLVLSLIFFVIAFFDPYQSFGILFEAEPEPAAETTELTPEDRANLEAAQEEMRDAVAELVAEGMIDESLVGPGGMIEIDTPGSPDESMPATEPAPAEDPSNDLVIDLDSPGFDINCDKGEYTVDAAPAWLQRRLTEARLKRLCERGKDVGPSGLLAAMLDNVPAALLILLPLLALVLKVLYPLSRRYYVEHLLFLVHFHSFLFLLLTLQVLWVRFINRLGWPEPVAVLPVVALAFYVPTYLYRGMRRVYEQGRFLTFLKFGTMSFVYVVSFSLVMIAAFVFAAFSL